jgi:hypothetical protein
VQAGFDRRESKEVVHRQNDEFARGLVVTTRVQAAGLVAATGLQMTAMLSREANVGADGDPAIANRLNFIVDQFATFAGNEVARFAL